MAATQWTQADIEDQSGRIAIVTGANSGIGFETAKALAARGARVILAVRDLGKGNAAANRIRADHPDADVSVRELDLASLDSVREFADKMQTQLDRLDLLINNAGVMMPPRRQETKDGFELQFGTNHLGHFALTLRLLDLLSQTKGSRIVNVSSLGHRMARLDVDDWNWERRPFHRIGSYGQSKLANLLFTFELQRRLEAAGSDTIVVAAHPGWTGTNLARYIPGAGIFNALIAMRPWQGALPSLYAATHPFVRGGQYFGPDGFRETRGYPVRVSASDEAHDRRIAELLWNLSVELTGLGETTGQAAA